MIPEGFFIFEHDDTESSLISYAENCQERIFHDPASCGPPFPNESCIFNIFIFIDRAGPNSFIFICQIHLAISTNTSNFGMPFLW
jgi:hypothetical protein